MILKSSIFKIAIVTVFAFITNVSFAQQDQQYTQYMYNTMAVNPAYAGQREKLSITGLYRTQWVGLDGAPVTQSLGIHAPLKNERVGLGLSIVNDKLGPAKEIYVNANVSYTIPLNYTGDLKLSFGLKGGVHQLSTDWSKGRYKNPDNLYSENISRFSPTLGFGFYLHERNWYLGLSIPDVIKTTHYDDDIESLAEERLHYYVIAGYVFDINQNLKLKPAALLKAVSGAPIIVDLSANFLINEKFTLGLAYRWDDSVSGLLGFQVSNEIYLGYSYDATTTKLNNYSNGSHEVMVRFELEPLLKVLSPRFF